ncbi:hypothetical protein D3C78_1251250 [compost metagenome]
MIGAEGGDFDDLAAELHMGQLEAAADHPGVAELGADLLRGGAGGHVVVLGLHAEQHVAHAAADQVGLVAGMLQALDHIDRIAAELPPLQRVLAVAEDLGGAAGMSVALEGRTERLEQLFQHGEHCVFEKTAVSGRRRVAA